MKFQPPDHQIMVRFTYTCMPNLLLFLFFIFIAIDLSTSARSISHKSPTPSGSDQMITFIMNDVLGSRYGSSQPPPPPSTEAPLQPPKPTSSYLAGGGVPLSHPFKEQAGLAGGWLPILSSAQGLEAGSVTIIDEELMGNVELGSLLLGKAQGIYVTSMEDSSSHIVAMRVTFASGETEDSLRLFGVHQPSLPESHIAVVGGTGKYQEANGVAILKAVASKVSSVPESMHHKVLSVHVYLK